MKAVWRAWVTQLPVMLTALAAVGALYFTAQSLHATRDQLGLSEQGQITDRFSKAVAQLGTKDSIEMRLGGIYALERIARDSERDHPTVMEVLSAFVREHAPVKTCATGPTKDGRPPTDVQAALTVLDRRDRTRDHDPLNLASSCLAGIQLTRANLTRADLNGANLTYADLNDTNLTDANLYGANLTGANFFDANFTRAYLFGANLTYADLGGADLTGAKLTNANLTNANLFSANFSRADLAGSNLTDAGLTGANLTGADLTGANLTGADLTGANLTGAKLPGAVASSNPQPPRR